MTGTKLCVYVMTAMVLAARPAPAAVLSHRVPRRERRRRASPGAGV